MIGKLELCNMHCEYLAQEIESLQSRLEAAEAVNMDHNISLDIIGGTAKSNHELQSRLEAESKRLSSAEKVIEAAAIFVDAEASTDSEYAAEDNLEHALATYKETQDDDGEN